MYDFRPPPPLNLALCIAPSLNTAFSDSTTHHHTIPPHILHQTSKNVLFSTYGIGVDTMTALRNTKVEEDQLYDYVTAATGVEQVVSVIAFRGNIRSEAQYVRSNSAITGGTGVVKGLGLIVTMRTSLEHYFFVIHHHMILYIMLFILLS